MESTMFEAANSRSPNRPDICIGTDDFHTPEWLEKKLFTSFERHGFSVELNRPFAGSIVPMKYYQKEPRVLSVMIELNRKLYMDEKTGEKSDRFENIKEILSETLSYVINSNHHRP